MKQKLLNLRETAIVVITIGVFTIGNSLHVITEWLKNTPGHIFNAIAHSYPDYFLYLSHIAQGAAGKLIFTDHQFTDEKLPHTAFYWMYSLAGFMGHLIGLSPPWSYNLSLLILTAVVLFLWYVLCRYLYPAKPAQRLATFLVVVSASPFINLSSLITRGVVEFPQYLWFSPTPSFNRLGGVPHQIAQIILLLLVLFGFAKAIPIKEYSWKTIGFIIGLTVLCFVATQSQPLQMALLLSAVGISTTITAVRDKRFDVKRFVPLALTGLVSIPAALSVSREYTTPIYAIAKQWELLQYTPTGLLWWIAVMGPIAILVPFGVWPFIKKAEPIRLTFFLYGLFSFICYNSPLPKLIGVVPQRFLHPASYALFPVLAVSGFFAIRKDLPRIFRNMFVISAIVVYAAFTIPADIAQITMRVSDPFLAQAEFLNHTPERVVSALQTLQNKNSAAPVVLADGNLGIDLLIPIYTNHPSFLGQAIHTLYPGEKEALRQQFFSGSMTDAESKQFLYNHRIGYIITGNNNVLHINTVTP